MGTSAPRNCILDGVVKHSSRFPCCKSGVRQKRAVQKAQAAAPSLSAHRLLSSLGTLRLTELIHDPPPKKLVDVIGWPLAEVALF